MIITACINNKYGVYNPWHREQRYKSSINACLNMVTELNKVCTANPILVVITENSSNTYSSYLDVFSSDICKIVYTRTNILYPSLHKASKELLDIHIAMENLQCIDNERDMIVKLTGRYRMLNSDFLERVIRDQDKYEAFVKFFNVCTLQYLDDDCVLGMFAIRAKYLCAFKYDFEFSSASAEVQFATFVKCCILPDVLCEMDSLGLECCFADDLRILEV